MSEAVTMIFYFLVVIYFTSLPIPVSTLTTSPPFIPGVYIVPAEPEPGTPREIYAVMSDKLQGRIIPGYEGVDVRSLVDCLRLCGEDLGCMSVFYQSVSKTCYQHNIVFISWNDTVPSEGTSYYSVGDANCPLEQGYVHKRSLKFCYLIVKDSANTTNAARTCREASGLFGYTFDVDIYNHLVEAFEGSFILRKRKFWTGLEYSDVTDEFVFNSLNAPDFGRWVANEGTANEGTTLQPSGTAGQCVETERDNEWNWAVTECWRPRAYICDYQGQGR